MNLLEVDANLRQKIMGKWVKFKSALVDNEFEKETQPKKDLNGN
jgi:hypothetical protein